MRGLLRAALAAGLVVSGCSPAPAPSPSPLPGISVFVSNGTTLAVMLVVNGMRVATSAPGSRSEVLSSALPPLPWSVIATTASGRVLTTMSVSIGDATQSDPNTHVIPMGRVDLSCGRLTIWAGDYPPSGPIRPSPAGSPGDCAP